jgi:xanthosine phosphorylase
MTAHKSSVIIKQLKPNFLPKIGIILGSGLGTLAEQIEDATILPYEQLSGLPKCGVAGHSGKLHLGTLRGTPVACLEGRAHVYEGNIDVIKTLIRTLKLIGCELLIVTNAAGSLRNKVGTGSLMLITDHINFQFANPLTGPNDDEFGERFVGMENAYDLELRKKILNIANRINIELPEGVYLGSSGPTFETPAEIRAFRILGADAVGMSTIADVIIARHCGLKVLAISAITNLAAGMNPEPLTHEQTLRAAKLSVDKLIALLLAFIEEV